MRISDWSSDVCSSDLEAMYSQDPALTINPFVSDGSSPASREFLQSLLVSFDHQSRSSTNGLTGYMRGKLFTLPAGNVIGLVGAESQKQTVRLETESPSFIGSNINGSRSEERRVGKECVSTCRSRGSTYP